MRVDENAQIDEFPFEENNLKVSGLVRGEDTFIDVKSDFKFLEDD